MTLYKSEKGFTLIEVIAVLIVLGIVAAIAYSRMAAGDVNLQAQSEALKSHIRYVQLRALNADATGACGAGNCEASSGISTTGNGYFMFRNCSTADRVLLPGADSSNSVSLPSGMTLTSTTVTFDRWGRPCSDQCGTVPATSDINLYLKYGGQTEQIQITKNTGFVP